MQTKRERRIGVYMEDKVTTFSFDLLDGIRDYASESGWQISARRAYAQTCGIEWLPEDPGAWQLDGVLMALQPNVGYGIVDDIKIPFVNIASFGHSMGYRSVLGDYEEHGRLAATHLIDHGIRTLMFVGYLDRAFSTERCAAFTECAEDRGAVVSRWSIHELGWAAIEKAIVESPKPLGIMADVDLNGSQVLALCRQHALAVPEDVAVVGVNNDRYICPFSRPALSSVDPNTRRIGYCAARELDGLMAGEAFEGTLWVKSAGLVPRASSEVQVGDPFVAEALELIQDRSGEISVAEIASSVGLSRRVLEKRFQARLGESPGEAIRRHKLSVVKQLLAETDMTLKEIAAKVNFSSAAYLSTAFKKAQGQTLLEYRRNFR